MVTQLKTLTLSQLIQRFLSSRRDLSPSTLKYYGTILANLEWYAKREGWPEATVITREHIRSFLSSDLLILDNFGLRRRLNTKQSTDLYEHTITWHRKSSHASKGTC